MQRRKPVVERPITIAEADRLQALAHEAFLTALPDLLAQHAGQWVAYRGAKQLGVAAGKTALLQQCRDRGFAPKELMVRKIRPGADEPQSVFETGSN